MAPGGVCPHCGARVFIQNKYHARGGCIGRRHAGDHPRLYVLLQLLHMSQALAGPRGPLCQAPERGPLGLLVGARARSLLCLLLSQAKAGPRGPLCQARERGPLGLPAHTGQVAVPLRDVARSTLACRHRPPRTHTVATACGPLRAPRIHAATTVPHSFAARSARHRHRHRHRHSRARCRTPNSPTDAFIPTRRVVLP